MPGFWCPLAEPLAETRSPARPQQRLVQDVGPVGASQHHHTGRGGEAVHLAARSSVAGGVGRAEERVQVSGSRKQRSQWWAATGAGRGPQEVHRQGARRGGSSGRAERGRATSTATLCFGRLRCRQARAAQSAGLPNQSPLGLLPLHLSSDPPARLSIISQPTAAAGPCGWRGLRVLLPNGTVSRPAGRPRRTETGGGSAAAISLRVCLFCIQTGDGGAD